MPVVKQCEHCGKEMQLPPSVAKRKRFCSIDCLNRSQYALTDVKCQQCDRIFQLTPFKAQNRRFCSIQCQSEFHHISKSETLKCEWCAKEYTRPKCRQKDGERHFCCKECKYLGLRKEGTRVQSICAHCGKDYQTTIHQIEKRGGKFCSRECMDAKHRTRPEPKAFYWRKTAAQVRKRDNFTCQRCGKIQKRPGLDVHHIIPARLFGIDNLTQANHPDNLISLCRSCHKIIESQPTHIEFFKQTGLAAD